MKNKYWAFSLFIILLFYIASCAPAQQPAINQPKASQPEPKVETAPKTVPAAEQPKQEISSEVSELLTRSNTRITSIYYKYKGPETGDNFYDFYIRGAKIKYNPTLNFKVLDQKDSYDTIFIDETSQTAQSYCVAAFCTYKGKKHDLKYADVYIPTILDWISDLTSAKKVGEELIDDRSTWKLDTNKGILWVDTFYGIPLKVDANGKIYRFQQIAVNSVQDSDVMPS